MAARRDVLAQLPRASQEIETGMTVEVEVGEIRYRLGRPVRRHLPERTRRRRP